MENRADPTENGVDSALANELARVYRALRTLSAGNRTLLRASDEQELLNEMCRVIVETGGYRMAAVAYAKHNTDKSICWMASHGIEQTLLETRNLSWADTDLGRSASAVAIRTNHPVVGRHLLTDPAYDGPAYAGVRDTAIQRGYASVTSFPLAVEGEVLGTLTMGAAEPDAFDEEEVKLLNELADDLAYGIANLRTRMLHRNAQATITRLAYYDPLTNLPNRTLLLGKLDGAITAAKQQKHTLALLYLEIGRFQEINKVLGYHAADTLLLHLSQRLADGRESHETLARVGDAEFAVLLPHADGEQAICTAQRLQRTLRAPVEVAGLMLDARVGIGIALYPHHATDANTLIRRANAAVQQAQPVHGGYAMYTGGQEQENTRRLALMADLHHAIETHQLQLYCQPKVTMASKHICGAEALVRWQHPQYGRIAPIEFIKLAEQAGTITPLTHWMLETAFSQISTWQKSGLEQALAVNLSAQDLYDPTLVDRIRGLFSTWAISPELLQFELTESTLMSDPSAALATLMRLKQMDVQLFIDDYGTGYSSLSYLQQLPVDAIKIDQSFVIPMVASRDSEVIVQSTIDMGHKLGLKVVAEGVESPETWGRLARLGCDVAQGYLIGRPMPADEFQHWNTTWLKIARQGKDSA
jgi:diguanylate cyclase (GGDEF)-like protein